jgi:hypothetical protein
MAIGANWKEIWAPVWAPVWTQEAPEPPEIAVGDVLFLTFPWIWDAWRIT